MANPVQQRGKPPNQEFPYGIEKIVIFVNVKEGLMTLRTIKDRSHQLIDQTEDENNLLMNDAVLQNARKWLKK